MPESTAVPLYSPCFASLLLLEEENASSMGSMSGCPATDRSSVIRIDRTLSSEFAVSPSSSAIVIILACLPLPPRGIKKRSFASRRGRRELISSLGRN